jgi:TIR domain-containing protein
VKVFHSWSGNRSQAVARAPREWLPSVLQAIEPWMSSADVEVGTRWSSELALRVQESRFGIICLTPENLDAPWVLFEAGALSKSLERAYVVPFLLGVKPSDLRGPLVQFQVVTATKEDIHKLILALNHALGEMSLDDCRLQQSFEVWWPWLEQQLATLLRETAPPEAHSATVAHDIGHLLLNQRPLSDNEREVLAKLVRSLSGRPERDEAGGKDLS